jgi:tetratricopeptide (TPR) repeat protein
MEGTRTHRRLPVRMRPLVVILLAVCLAATDFSSAQQAPSGPFPGSAWTALAQGRVADAESLARTQPAGDPDGAAILAHLAARKGQYEEAVRMLEPIAAEHPGSAAALELGLLHQRLGRPDAGAKVLTAVFRQASTATNAEALGRAARAARALNRPQDANSLYRTAVNLSGSSPALESAWGDLFIERFREAEAMQSFQQALKADPRWAPAHLGVAQALIDENPPAAAAAAGKALEIDPTLDAAILLLAQLDLDNSREDAARERIEKLLSHNPRHLDALALRGAMAYVKGDTAAFDREVRGILEINPAFGEVYRVAGDLAARNYRFDEAVAMTRRAIALDPSSRALADLGMHLLRTGDEREAREVLERSFTADRSNRITFNLLALLDKLDAFTVVEDGDVVVKMHPDEAPVLREYAIPLAKEALKTLSEKYQFTPRAPTLIEIFPEHDDFAVRNLGLPGMIGALGACFGRVVTMDSPKARAPGEFSWQATLWHEIAHVITLQMSNQRVPRWLTEGISVYEEGLARPQWGRDMEVSFAAALEQGKTLKLTDLNSGFTSPETIAIAYFQASLLVDHIVKTYGHEKLRGLLLAYGEGLEGDAALTKTLGASMEQLQAAFDKTVDARFGELRRTLRPVPNLDRQSDPSALAAVAAANPNSYQANLAYGRALASSRDKAAFEPLSRAAALVPMAIGEESPRALMGQLAEQLGDHARALQEYRELLAHDHTAIEPARRMAALAEKLGNAELAGAAYDRIVELDPSDAAAHTGLGRLAMKKNQVAVAVREFKAALALKPPDRAAAHCDLGEAYLAAGNKADAKREALAALEIAPSFDRAQELLLKAIQSGAEPRP